MMGTRTVMRPQTHMQVCARTAKPWMHTMLLRVIHAKHRVKRFCGR